MKERKTLLISNLLNLISPPYCELCSKLIVKYPRANQRNFLHSNIICNFCLLKIEAFKWELREDHCQICNCLLLNHNICISCRSAFGDQIYIDSLFTYQNEIKKLVKLIKYHSRLRLMRYLMEKMLERVISLNRFMKLDSSPYVIPAPSFLDSILNRGFNSTYFMANILKRNLNSSILEVKFNGDEQYLGKQNTWKRKGIRKFIIPLNRRKYALYKKNVVIFDDVITSGSTILGIIEALKIKGVEKILVVSIARSIYYPKLVAAQKQLRFKNPPPLT